MSERRMRFSHIDDRGRMVFGPQAPIEDRSTEMDATCERPGCSSWGRRYCRQGYSVSTGPSTYTSTMTPPPEEPITLCADHALEAFGVAFTSLPGDPGAARRGQ